jgi:hypothetical protein
MARRLSSEFLTSRRIMNGLESICRAWCESCVGSMGITRPRVMARGMEGHGVSNRLQKQRLL